MKKLTSTLTHCLLRGGCSTSSHPWRKLPSLIVVAAVLLLASLLSPMAQAQTTIKPFQIRIEVPTGFNGTVLLTNNVMKVLTNGASVTDITGADWIINPVNLTITGAPGGCTATLLAS